MEKNIQAVSEGIQKLHKSLSPEQRAIFRGILQQAKVSTFNRLEKPINVTLAPNFDLPVVMVDDIECW